MPPCDTSVQEIELGTAWGGCWGDSRAARLSSRYSGVLRPAGRKAVAAPEAILRVTLADTEALPVPLLPLSASLDGARNAIASRSGACGVQVRVRVSLAEACRGRESMACVEASTCPALASSSAAAAAAVRCSCEAGDSSARALADPARRKAASVHPVAKFPQLLGSGVTLGVGVEVGVRVAVVERLETALSEAIKVALARGLSDGRLLGVALGRGEGEAVPLPAVPLPLARRVAVPAPADALPPVRSEGDGAAEALAPRAEEGLRRLEALPVGALVSPVLGVAGREREAVARSHCEMEAEGVSLGVAVGNGAVGEAVEGREGVSEADTLAVPAF